MPSHLRFHVRTGDEAGESQICCWPDRDADAEYFQIYTQTFEQRFFFEIVERRSGYKGFGAPNAQIRLTAQTFLAQDDVHAALR